MCGPSSEMKAINKQIQNFASTVQSEASDVFGKANQVFNKITGALDKVINGGPGQNGWSATENAARTAATIQAGGTEARNLRGAAASAVAAIGGGNQVAPSGTSNQINLDALGKAASDTAAGLNNNQIANAEAGRDEFNKAVQGELEAPGVFDASAKMNSGVSQAQQTAAQSQQEIDQESNWAMNDVMKLGSAALSGWASGGFKMGGGSKPSGGGLTTT